MKTTIQKLTFPCEIKKKLKMKVCKGNLDISFIDGNILKFDKTNLSINEPYKIVVKNSNSTLIAYIYDDSDKVYLPNNNMIISLTKYISILNLMNKN